MLTHLKWISTVWMAIVMTNRIESKILERDDYRDYYCDSYPSSDKAQDVMCAVTVTNDILTKRLSIKLHFDTAATIKCIDCNFQNLKEQQNIEFNSYPSYNVQSADFSDSHIRYVGANSIVEVNHNDYKLKRLNLSYNAIEKLGEPQIFAKVPGLTVLDLSHNRIKEIHGEAFDRISNIKVLLLAYNSLKHLSVRTFSDLSNLAILHLSNNILSTIEPNTFINNNRLGQLTLNNNNIGHIGDGVFKYLQHLEILDLSNNFIAKLYDSTFAELINLKYINLTNNRLQEIGQWTFSQQQYLEIFDVSQNNLKVLPNRMFDSVEKLNELYLSGNELSELSLTDLNVRKLNKIGIANNAWNCATLDSMLKYVADNDVDIVGAMKVIGANRTSHDIGCTGDSNESHLQFIILGIAIIAIVCIVAIVAWVIYTTKRRRGRMTGLQNGH